MTHHVLLVDDDPIVLRVLTRVLDPDDLGVSTAPDGAAAVETVARDRPDVAAVRLTAHG